MQNLQLLVERIKNFYLLNMQQLIIGSLPDIVSVCISPESGTYPLALYPYNIPFVSQTLYLP